MGFENRDREKTEAPPAEVRYRASVRGSYYLIVRLLGDERCAEDVLHLQVGEQDVRLLRRSARFDP